MAETTVTLGLSMAVALLFPKAAEKMFAITGATAVCCVCYVIPVYIHFATLGAAKQGRLLPPAHHHQRHSSNDADALLGAPLLPTSAETPPPALTARTGSSAGRSGRLGGGARGCWRAMARALSDYVLPLLVLLIGVGFSVAAVWVAALDIKR